MKNRRFNENYCASEANNESQAASIDLILHSTDPGRLPCRHRASLPIWGSLNAFPPSLLMMHSSTLCSERNTLSNDCHAISSNALTTDAISSSIVVAASLCCRDWIAAKKPKSST